jgi:hypothetical protein
VSDLTQQITLRLSPHQLVHLLARPSWVVATLLLGLAVMFPLIRLGFAPLIVVQPLGGYFVQTAYSVGSPDLVIAALTVVDPLVAVLIGVMVLGEAALIPPVFAVLATVAGSMAILGVLQLAKYHPRTHRFQDAGPLPESCLR